MSEPAEQYPGSGADPDDLVRLADQYRIAAAILDQFGPRGDLASAPFRLAALQAIELYLNALLLKSGYSDREIRGLQHKVGLKLKLAMEKGLALDARTIAHVDELDRSREYLVSRYDPNSVAMCSPINRINSTLRKVGDGTRKALAA